MSRQVADPRSSAARILDRTLATRRPARRLLTPALDGLDPRDGRLLQELVYGGLRWLRRLDQLIESASGRPMERIDAPLHSPLRIGAYQLFFLDRVPAHAAVDAAVREARRRSHKGGAGFVNAVLRRLAREPDLLAWPVKEPDALQRLAIEESHPDTMVARWHKRFGDPRTRRLLAANNRPRPLHLLALVAGRDRAELARSLAAEGVDTEPSKLSPYGLVTRGGQPLDTAAFRRGELYVQDEASQAAALLPPPRAGERVLDAAASPGGKSFALLAAEPDLGILAGDVSLSRLAELRDNRSRLGLRLPLFAGDALHPPFEAGFDRVVADLPCTGTGTLRKHPELKWRFRVSELTRLAERGGRMLEGLAPLVAPGGLLVAITCSLEPEENEEVVEAFLARTPGFRRESLAEGLVGEPAAHLETPDRWRVLPGGDHDGFTVHVLRRG